MQVRRSQFGLHLALRGQELVQCGRFMEMVAFGMVSEDFGGILVHFLCCRSFEIYGVGVLMFFV